MLLEKLRLQRGDTLWFFIHLSWALSTPGQDGAAGKEQGSWAQGMVPGQGAFLQPGRVGGMRRVPY